MPGSPASLNRYSYVWNNPYKYVDPTGREVVVVGAKMEAAVKQLRATNTGEALYKQLHESKHVFTLKEESGGWAAYSRPDSDYLATRGWKTGEGSGGTTVIDFGKKFLFKDQNGTEQEAPVAQVLGHEMQHLADYDQGHLDRNPDRSDPQRRPVSETDAVRTENRIRGELSLPGKVGDGPTRTLDK